MSTLTAPDCLTTAALVFWDFDGVIKDSVDVKTRAFSKLFETYGDKVVDRVKAHHEANGGMSRFEKIPIYLRWAGELSSEKKVKECFVRFRKFALRGVIEAPWVPGVEAYIRGNCQRKHFVLVSATPQAELESILQVLKLVDSFEYVYGAPTSKETAIRRTLKIYDIDPRKCLMIGDASADFEAAQANDVPFLLRRHSSNGRVFADYSGPSIDNFNEL